MENVRTSFLEGENCSNESDARLLNVFNRQREGIRASKRGKGSRSRGGQEWISFFRDLSANQQPFEYVCTWRRVAECSLREWLGAKRAREER